MSAIVNRGETKLSGTLKTKLIKGPNHPAQAAPLIWKIRNWLRLPFVWGWLAYHLAGGFSKLTGIVTLRPRLKAILIKADGTRVDFGVVGYRVVTSAFVNFMVDQMQAESTQWGDFKYHDSGVGTTAENSSDTDIETTDGESRATGTQTEGASANIYASVGTISYTTTKAITEHGLFSQSTGTTLLDRTVFSAINVVSGDSIQFTYELTVSAGS